jgi:NAD(P)-dependent dehydrogenase (short-subunit alcohol dehydrogenase family)
MEVAVVADAFLEVSVVGSFSSVGYVARRRLFDWRDPDPDALVGRTVAITGPTSGLGRACAFALAGLGARLLLLGRNAEKLAGLRSDLVTAMGADRFVPVVVDMASLASIRSAVTAITATEPRLDALVDNAGAIFPSRRESPDGIEATIATMVVGPLALVSGLRGPLRAAPGGGRVISVTSGGMYTQGIELSDLEWRRRPWSGPRVYAQSKRIQVALMREWARRERGVTFTAMHPGWVDTPGLAEQLPAFHRVMRPILRTPQEGIDTIVWQATMGSPGSLSGRLYLDRRPRPFDRVPATRVSASERRDLWERMTGLAGVSGN